MVTGGVIGPDDHLATIARRYCIRAYLRIDADMGGGGVHYIRIFPLIIPPDQHYSTTKISRRIGTRTIEQGDLLTEQQDAAARAIAAARFDEGFGKQGAALRADVAALHAIGADTAVEFHCQFVTRGEANLARLRPVGGDLAARCECQVLTGFDGDATGDLRWRELGRKVFTFENDFAVFDDRGIGVERTGVVDAAPEHANLAGLGNHLAEVDRFAIGCLDFNKDIGITRVGDGDFFPRGKNDLPLGRGDHAAVPDAGCDQPDFATGRCGDLALVDDFAGLVATLEFEPARNEIAVLEVKAGGDKAGGVDAAGGADNDAVGVDQEYLAVGLQLPEYGRRGAAGDAVEHRACRTLLDEAGSFVLGD